jgi:hypothetical protein
MTLNTALIKVFILRYLQLVHNQVFFYIFEYNNEEILFIFTQRNSIFSEWM